MSIVGHDLRTAIGGVLSLSQMVDKKLESGDLEDAQRLSGLLRRSALDADDLLKDLLTWSRSTHEEYDFKLTSLDLQEVIQTEVRRLENMALQKNQSIRVEIDETGIVRADPYMLSSILRNLLSNALKFSHTESQITIRSERKPGYWQVHVSDEGIGMSEDLQTLILKIDERKQQTGTSGEKGSGFGLLLCEDFIVRHGGHLTWTSAPGKGSTFSFTLPELLG